MTTREQGLNMEALEGMVDRHGFLGVLQMLSEVCGLKAEHIETNWQDVTLAQWWAKRAEAVDKLAARPFCADA